MNRQIYTCTGKFLAIRYDSKLSKDNACNSKYSQIVCLNNKWPIAASLVEMDFHKTTTAAFTGDHRYEPVTVNLFFVLFHNPHFILKSLMHYIRQDNIFNETLS